MRKDSTRRLSGHRSSREREIRPGDRHSRRRGHDRSRPARRVMALGRLDRLHGAGLRPGTTGSSAGIGAAAATTTGRGRRGTTAGASNRARADSRPGPRGVRRDGQEEVVPVGEEELQVGKREVSHGRVRVRSYVVETPVSEQVNLRQENVSVERRPVDRAARRRQPIPRADHRGRGAHRGGRGLQGGARQGRTRRQEGVEQRTETVSDKVRRTEVEVEDDRGKALRSGERNTR